MRSAVVLLIPTCLFGCWEHPDPQAPLPSVSIVTNFGCSLRFVDQGSLSTGLYTEADISTMYDQSVEDAAIYLWRYGVEPEDVKNAAIFYPCTVTDAFYFRTAWSPTGHATGQIDIGHSLTLAFWTRQRNADGPTWTYYDWGGTTDVQSGLHPDDFPALAHELGHHFFGMQFEHGWTPPVINGTATLAAQDWSDRCAIAR